MEVLVGVVLCALCTAAFAHSADEKDHKDDILYEILRLSSLSEIDQMDSGEINELAFANFRESLDNVDFTALMDMDEADKRQLGIHSKVYCHCHQNHCKCCKTVYLFWRIAVFKACIGVWYEGNDFVMRLQVYGITLVKHRLGLLHQKPVCARVFGMYDLCAQLYNVKIKNGVVHACLKILKPVPINVGCFTLHRRRHQSQGPQLSWQHEDDPDLTLAEDYISDEEE